MIKRSKEMERLSDLLKLYPVVAIIGARQVGKTTLATSLANQMGGTSSFDLENPEDRAKLSDAMLALKPLQGLVVLDEIQNMPGLFQPLRVLADRRPIKTRFLVLGSASPDLLRQSSESLAGRIAYHELDGFSLDETGIKSQNLLWLRGGFPDSFLAKTANESLEWRNFFIRTFIERDLPQLGIKIESTALRRFWTMLAHYHGQVWNASEFGRSFGVADTTVRRYLDTLSSALVVRQLQPWHENISKRQVKSPKVYIRDSGLLHALLNLKSMDELLGHPKMGASWEGFVIKEIVRQLGADSRECYFWATHTGAELDLLVVRGNKRWGFEVKRTSAPEITPSMRSALKDLKLERLDLVHAGKDTFPLATNVRAVALQRLLKDIEPLS
ncbi:ATP-binding protein [Candidatus Acetothermia bacterium]|nr:ATP-binding protein [Candidatus Acetothermia bacterium]